MESSVRRSAEIEERRRRPLSYFTYSNVQRDNESEKASVWVLRIMANANSYLSGTIHIHLLCNPCIKCSVGFLLSE